MAQQFWDNVQDIFGNAQPGAQVTVTNYPLGSTASIFSDYALTIPLANPFILSNVTGTTGIAPFFAANGAYQISVLNNGATEPYLRVATLYDPANDPQRGGGAVSTIATLRTINTTQPAAITATVANYATAGDGGGGDFTLVASDTTSADNGITIIVDGANRRWYRSFSGPIDARWNGGIVGGSSVTNNAAIQGIINLISATTAFGFVFVPAGMSYTVGTLTLPTTIGIFDAQTAQIVLSKMGLISAQGGGGGHLLVRHTTANTAGRLYIEPNGDPIGNQSKLDMMFDPYEPQGVSPANYRIGSLDTQDDTVNGTNGAFLVNAKAVGNDFGIWPSINVGFSDNGATGVPLKIMLFDTSDTAWRPGLLTGCWASGRTVSSTSNFILNAFHLYQAASTGTTGNTPPTHTSGTVSDGGVNWTFIRDYSGATSNNIKPCVVVGDRDQMPLFGFLNYRAQFLANTLFDNAIQLTFVKAPGGVKSAGWNQYSPLNTSDLYIQSADTTALFRFGFASGSSTYFTQRVGLADLKSYKTDATGSATPDITGADGITFNNASPTSVTGFSNGLPNQEFRIRAANGNTTLVNGANLKTNTGANKVLTANSQLMFSMNTAGTVATEMGTL